MKSESLTRKWRPQSHLVACRARQFGSRYSTDKRDHTAVLSLLRDNPLMGRQQDYLLVSLRSFTVRGYMIFYQPFENGIDILRILHSSRDVETIFERFFENL